MDGPLVGTKKGKKIWAKYRLVMIFKYGVASTLMLVVKKMQKKLAKTDM